LFYKVLLLFIFSIVLSANVETSSSLVRQKMEILELKNELTNFYEQKEKEYQTNKKDLEDMLAKIEQEKAEVKRMNEKNEETLKDIRAEIKQKSIRIFEQMKAKVAAEIFDQMILEGKIEDVFDIIIRLKESNISNIMKFLSLENASVLTQKLERYNKNKDTRD